MSPRAARLWFVVLSVLVSLVAATIMAEHSLRFRDYQEELTRQSLMDYQDTTDHKNLGRGGYLRPNFKAEVTDGLGGRVRWANNASGFRHDEEFAEYPEPGVLRILSLGDSFTAGYRVDQTETFSYLLEKWAGERFGKVEVLVSEIDSPAIGLYYLDRFGVKFHPHIVLLGITLGNDIFQTYKVLNPKGWLALSTAGGKVHIGLNPASDDGFTPEQMEYDIPPEYQRQRSPCEKFALKVWRRLRSTRLLPRLNPQCEPIASVEPSNRDRPKLFDMVNGLGVFTKPPPPEMEEAYRRLWLTLQGFQDLCESRGILLVVQLFPQRYQVQPGDWQKAVREYALNESCFDLMAPNHRIRLFCREQGITCLDPTEAMSRHYLATKKSLYLPRGDMHWNREGQRAFFESARPSYEKIIGKGLEKVGRRAWSQN